MWLALSLLPPTGKGRLAPWLNSLLTHNSPHWLQLVGGFLVSNYNSAFMGLYFHVQLLVKGPSSEEESVVRMPCLGNAAIRRTIAPLMEKHEFNGELCIPSMGELPFHVGSDAYLAVQELHKSFLRKLDDAHRERDELFENPALGNWSVAHEFIENLKPYADLIRNTLSAVESISGNSNVKARIVWC